METHTCREEVKRERERRWKEMENSLFCDEGLPRQTLKWASILGVSEEKGLLRVTGEASEGVLFFLHDYRI